MNRYDHLFRGQLPHIRAIPRYKIDSALSALFEHRNLGFGPEDDEAVVRQFDLSGMAEFWEIRLSEPMTCADFIHALAPHFFVIERKRGLTEEEWKKLGPAAHRVENSVKAGIRQALRAARSYDQPWFTVIPEPPPSSKLDPKAWIGLGSSDTVFVPADPPIDGIDLNKLRVQPRQAVAWMLASAQRRHLVPPSLVRYISGGNIIAPRLTTDKPKRGRPKGTDYSISDERIAHNALEILKRGEAKSSTAAVWSLVGRGGEGAEGNGQPESKVERIVKVVNRLKAAENNPG